jgi:hypothetical protein
MEPAGSNDGVLQINVANESLPTLKNTLKALLWEILVKREVRKGVDCQQILYTYIQIVVEERKQSGQNRIELTAEKIILTIPKVVAAAVDDDDDNKT